MGGNTVWKPPRELNPGPKFRTLISFITLGGCTPGMAGKSASYCSRVTNVLFSRRG